MFLPLFVAWSHGITTDAFLFHDRFRHEKATGLHFLWCGVVWCGVVWCGVLFIL
jgi:hypothetical protein